jgi:hypothetical protein
LWFLPDEEFWVSAETAHFPFLVPIPIPFGIGKLAQERTAFAQKRNKANLILNRCAPSFYVAQHHWQKRSRTRRHNSALEVPLDAAKTKLEDCQRDIGKNLRDFLRDFLGTALS